MGSHSKRSTTNSNPPLPASDPEVVTVGRISVDLYPETEGPMRDVRSLVKSVGGTATNVAVAAARLGRRAAVVTKVGGDAFGDDIVHALSHRFGVDTRWVTLHDSLKTPLAFAELNPRSEPNIIFYREPRAPDMDLVPDDVATVPVEDIGILWIPASRFSSEPSRSTVEGLLQRRQRATHTILDLDWRHQFWPDEANATAAIGTVLEHFTVVIGNREECRIAVGTDSPDLAADRILATGAQCAVVKLGGDGVMVATADGICETVAPYPIEVVCGLGAGDAFGGAFCDSLLSGLDFVESARRGNAAGAIVASRLLCADDMPYRHEVDEVCSSGAA